MQLCARVECLRKCSEFDMRGRIEKTTYGQTNIFTELTQDLSCRWNMCELRLNECSNGDSRLKQETENTLQNYKLFYISASTLILPYLCALSTSVQYSYLIELK